MKAPHARLKEWRDAAGLTQAAAAKRSGVRQATWCEVETGRRTPHLAFAIRLESLTDGEVRIEHWGHDAALIKSMADVVAHRITGTDGR